MGQAPERASRFDGIGRLRLNRAQDGPAIRAETLIKYATHLLDRRPADKAYVFAHLYSTSPDTSKLIINLDLDYVCKAWKEPTFDLWEEVNAGGKGVGGHFYDLMVSRRALLSGAAFAARIKDAGSAKRYTAAANDISAALEKFWNPTGKLGLEDPPGTKREDGVFLKPDGEMSASPKGLADDLARVPKEVLKQAHIVPTLNRSHGQPKPMQVDVCVTLALNHGGDRTTTDASRKGDDGESVWAPWGERALATLDRTVEVFSHVYAINRTSPSGPTSAVAIGRYPEDCYDGVGNSVGHPWFLACHGVAESLYLCSTHFSLVDKIVVTPHSASFFKRFDPTLGAGATLHRGDARFERVVKGLRLWADAFLELGQDYADPDGKMSEQFHRKTGRMRGARELTWSYSSWLSAEEARRGRSIM